MTNMMKKVTITVDGKGIEAPEHGSLLGVLLDAGWDIPHLCHHEAVSPYGACRLCLVEVNQKGWKHDWRKLTTSCNFPVLDGLTVYTRSDRIAQDRRVVAELLLASAPGSERIREVAASLGVQATRFEEQGGDCILCGLCARVCEEVVGVHALTFTGRGTHKGMTTSFDESSSECIACGACVWVCPTRCIGLAQDGCTRTIDRWGRTLDLQVSEQSGVAWAPRFQLEHFSKRTGLLPDFWKTAPGEVEKK